MSLFLSARVSKSTAAGPRGKAPIARELGRNLKRDPYPKVPDLIPQGAGRRTPRCRVPDPKVPDTGSQGAGRRAPKCLAGYSQLNGRAAKGRTSKCRVSPPSPRRWPVGLRGASRAVPQSAGLRTSRCRVPDPKVPEIEPQSAGLGMTISMVVPQSAGGRNRESEPLADCCTTFASFGVVRGGGSPSERIRATESNRSGKRPSRTPKCLGPYRPPVGRTPKCRVLEVGPRPLSIVRELQPSAGFAGRSKFSLVRIGFHRASQRRPPVHSSRLASRSNASTNLVREVPRAARMVRNWTRSTRLSPRSILLTDDCPCLSRCASSVCVIPAFSRASRRRRKRTSYSRDVPENRAERLANVLGARLSLEHLHRRNRADVAVEDPEHLDAALVANLIDAAQQVTRVAHLVGQGSKRIVERPVVRECGLEVVRIELLVEGRDPLPLLGLIIGEGTHRRVGETRWRVRREPMSGNRSASRG